MSTGPLASVVVPVWRDREPLEGLVRAWAAPAGAELIVAAPLGEASTYRDLTAGRDCRLVEGPRGRASQMNAGAAAARGRWLLFLHTDSRLPDGWLDVLARADALPDVAGGAYRFALDSRDWRARVLERAVRLRVRLFRLPYGDQGIFVRRTVFEAMNGFADLPLMEDVDLVRRLRSRGRLLFVPDPVTTSARRWARDGWVRRSAANVSLLARYRLGVPPARLAQRYAGRRRAAVVMMGRAPWCGGKTRLQAGDETAHAALREALFFDTLDAVRAVPHADALVACEPAGETARLRSTVGSGADVFAQRGESLGDRMAAAIEDAFRLGYESVVVVGSDLPDLPPGRMAGAAARLGTRGDRVVLGPAADGGYYLVGVNRPHPEIFAGIDWGTSAVLHQTREAAARARLEVVELEPWRDIDGMADLERLAARSDGTAPRTRAWIAAHLDRRSEGS